MPTATTVVQEVVEPTPEPSPADYTDEQLRASGWSDEQIQELRGVAAIPVTDAFDSLGTAAPDVSAEESGSSLPTFNCIVTGNVLTASDSWWQCSSCGGFAEATAISQYTNCPACNMAR